MAPPDTPMLIISPNDEFVASTTQIAFRCFTSESRDHTYKFIKNTNEVVDAGDNSFVIESATTADSGTYACVVVVGGVDSSTSNPHTVTIIGELKLIDRCPYCS